MKSYDSAIRAEGYDWGDRIELGNGSLSRWSRRDI
jgi:hypothetical protein